MMSHQQMHFSSTSITILNPMMSPSCSSHVTADWCRTTLRPIIDYTESNTYNLSRALVDILKPLVGKTEYFAKNTASFTKDIKDIAIEEGEIMNSHDVVSLFTNVPVIGALKVIETIERGQDTVQIDQPHAR